MKPTETIRLRVAIQLLCQANPGSTYSSMWTAIDDLAGHVVDLKPLRGETDEQFEQRALRKFELSLQPHHRLGGK